MLLALRGADRIQMGLPPPAAELANPHTLLFSCLLYIKYLYIRACAIFFKPGAVQEIILHIYTS
jgi:hypothetical protein